MAQNTENSINPSQLAYLQSTEGEVVLPCWTNQVLRKGYGHIQPNSGACQSIRYSASVQPSVLRVEDMEKPEGSLLARACSTCPIMAQAIALLQTISL